MEDARTALLDRIVEDVAVNGIGGRSLRDLAGAVGSSHRMLLYHFGSREGLVQAVVEWVEQSQRDLLRDLAADSSTARDLIVALWARLTAPELRPFVRLFFEALATRPPAEATDDALTAPWLDASLDVAEQLGIDVDATDLRLGVAVTRGLLIDVLASGQVEPATAALHRFLDGSRF